MNYCNNTAACQPLDRVRNYLAKIGPAVSGQGGHLTAFKAARAILSFGLDDQTGWSLFTEWNQANIPPFSEGELLHKWRSLDRTRVTLKDTSTARLGRFSPSIPRPQRQKAAPDQQSILRVIRDSSINYLGDLSMHSDPLGDRIDPAKWLKKLYKPGSLLCLGKSIWDFNTETIEHWCEMPLNGFSFLVPNPMTARTGTNLEGRTSERTKQNSNRVPYMVVEFDPGSEGPHGELLWSFDNQARIVWHLSRFRPLVMVVDSGGKSLHSWFRVTAENRDPFQEYAFKLGADISVMRDISHMARLPDGTRFNSGQEKILKNNRATWIDRTQDVLFFKERNCQ